MKAAESLEPVGQAPAQAVQLEPDQPFDLARSHVLPEPVQGGASGCHAGQVVLELLCLDLAVVGTTRLIER